jgi:phosphatidylserine decarboxylase
LLKQRPLNFSFSIYLLYNDAYDPIDWNVMDCRPQHQIRLYDRRRRTLETELVCGRRWMELIYGTLPGRLLAEWVLCRPVFSKFYGRLQRHPRSRRRIDPFIAQYGIELNEAVVPWGGYRSFNDFFIRRLKPTARPIDPDPRRLISPADSRLQIFTIHDHTWISIKGSPVTLSHLLGIDHLETVFEGGLALVFRLAPSDYHRFGYVAEGRQTAVRVVGGPLHSVNPMALRHKPDIHFINQRHWCRIENRLLGSILQVEVGAMLVGSIIQHQAQGGVCRRGQEKGYFQFGGSTVIVVLEPQRVQIDADIVAHSGRGIETLVRYGEAVGTLQ